MEPDENDIARLTLRCRRLNDSPFRRRHADYVLCWLQQTLRGTANPVIDAAIALGDTLGLPVVVYHGLGRGYPHASHRLHRFILEASRSLERDVEARGLRFLRFVERLAPDGDAGKGLVYRLAERAGAVVLDEQAAFVGRWQAERVATRLAAAPRPVAVIAVDGARLVPELAIGETCRTTASFRARVNAEREHWIEERLDLPNRHPRFDDGLAIRSDALDEPPGTPPDSLPDAPTSGPPNDPPNDLVDSPRDGQRDGADSGDDPIDALIGAAGVDMTLPPVTWCRGGRDDAERHLLWAANAVVPGYAARRNDPSAETTTSLSPWLHFGVLSPHDVVRAIEDSDASSRDTWKFLDELLVWREHFHHLARHADDPASYENLPASARDTLAAHANDPRPTLYPLDALVHGETSDETWNAAQRQFLALGWMHNNLRMYWGKKLIEWTASPEAAWRTACWLNDHLSLDGRDPATYGNLRWCFGASRPASEVAVYGRVARRGDGAIRRRAGDDWIRRAAIRPVPRIAVPDEITLHSRPQASGAGT